MDGSKLIVLATFIGLVCFVFTTLPFIAFVAAGIMKDDKANNDKSVMEVLLKALGWHLLAVIVLIFIINVFNIVSSNIEDNLIKGKCMEIFWTAASDGWSTSSDTGSLKNKIIGLAEPNQNKSDELGLGDNTYQKDGAFAYLYTATTLIRLFYAWLPVMVFFLSTYIGWKTASKKQDSNAFSTLVSMSGYIILGLFVYITWIFTANIGMFIPSGISGIDNLFDLKSHYWSSALKMVSDGINITF